tara:strand:+ start:760 stop:1245 length:486 start_codon:yes stop_codon:yes gene_type:complete
MSQTTVQGTFLANNSVTAIKILDRSVSGTELANNLTISSNTTFTGANTVFTGHVNLASANVVGLGIAKWYIVNANTNLKSSNNYFANTKNTLTLTLPSSASIGDTIRIIDNEGFASSNNITISRNGHLIQGQSANLTINTSRAALGLVYSTAGNGWLLLEN